MIYNQLFFSKRIQSSGVLTKHYCRNVKQSAGFLSIAAQEH